MVKFDKQSFREKSIFSMILLHAHAQYIFIVCTKYQKTSVKALVEVDFSLYAISKHKQTGKKSKFTKLSFCKKKKKKKNDFLESNFFMQMFNVSMLRRQSIKMFSKSCGTS